MSAIPISSCAFELSADFTCSARILKWRSTFVFRQPFWSSELTALTITFKQKLIKAKFFKKSLENLPRRVDLHFVSLLSANNTLRTTCVNCWINFQCYFCFLAKMLISFVCSDLFFLERGWKLKNKRTTRNEWKRVTAQVHGCVCFGGCDYPLKYFILWKTKRGLLCKRKVNFGFVDFSLHSKGNEVTFL